MAISTTVDVGLLLSFHYRGAHEHLYTRNTLNTHNQDKWGVFLTFSFRKINTVTSAYSATTRQNWWFSNIRVYSEIPPVGCTKGGVKERGKGNLQISNSWLKEPLIKKKVQGRCVRWLACSAVDRVRHYWPWKIIHTINSRRGLIARNPSWGNSASSVKHTPLLPGSP